MAGLCAAARARELGLEPRVLEKGDRSGGSMRLSSGVVWRYRSLDVFRRECPDGEERLQQQIVDRLDDALAWLEGLGAPVLAKETRNPQTLGWRFEPHGLTEALVRAAGDVQTGRGLAPGTGTRPLVLATGGFPVRLARERGLLIRSNRWSEGDGLELAREVGAATTEGMDEFYGRAMPARPADWGEDMFVQLAQLYGHFARVVDEEGEQIQVDPNDWSENNLVQKISRRPGGRAWYLVDHDKLGCETPYGTIGEVIDRARAVGAKIEEQNGRGYAVHVAAAVTHTIGGVAIDEQARVLDEGGTPLEGLYAAGVDAGGVATGGYASGLAAALVQGLAAAEDAAS